MTERSRSYNWGPEGAPKPAVRLFPLMLVLSFVIVFLIVLVV
jgi:hypothetical protein